MGAQAYALTLLASSVDTVPSLENAVNVRE